VQRRSRLSVISNVCGIEMVTGRFMDVDGSDISNFFSDIEKNK